MNTKKIVVWLAVIMTISFAVAGLMWVVNGPRVLNAGSSGTGGSQSVDVQKECALSGIRKSQSDQRMQKFILCLLTMRRSWSIFTGKVSVIGSLNFFSVIQMAL